MLLLLTQRERIYFPNLAQLNVAQIKKRNYRDRHPINQFFPLAIEIFRCLHKQVDVLLHDYANAIWSLKGPKGLHLFSLVTFFCQKISITLQKV
jgi:hypothetical protein